MNALVASALAVVQAVSPLPFDERVAGERAVEKARYAFVIGATQPFDEVYPRSVFEKRVRRQLEEERVLTRAFGMSITPEILAKEYDRIEKETRAPEQWEAMKAAAGSRRTIEEIYCRPLLVDRALRARFAFDPKIHAAQHEKARAARKAFLEGNPPAGAKILRLSWRVETAASTDELLQKARADAEGPRVLSAAEPRTKDDRPLPVDPEMVKVLEKELKSRGDVTTILEERDRFSVFRLVAADADEWLVESIQISKRDYDSWRRHGGRIPTR